VHSAGSPRSPWQSYLLSRGRDLLAQCPALVHLNLWSNGIGTADTGSFAGVLTQCSSLTRLHLEYNTDSHRICREREAPSFVTWSSLWSSFVGSLYCFLFAICLPDRQNETATSGTHTARWPDFHFYFELKKSL
jgi:hypothetical protein